MVVILLPNTNRLRQLIRDHGESWDLIESRIVPCFNGLGHMIKSIDGKHERWVRPQDIKIKEQSDSAAQTVQK